MDKQSQDILKVEINHQMASEAHFLHNTNRRGISRAISGSKHKWALEGALGFHGTALSTSDTRGPVLVAGREKPMNKEGYLWVARGSVAGSHCVSQAFLELSPSSNSSSLGLQTCTMQPN